MSALQDDNEAAIIDRSIFTWKHPWAGLGSGGSARTDIGEGDALLDLHTRVEGLRAARLARCSLRPPTPAVAAGLGWRPGQLLERHPRRPNGRLCWKLAGDASAVYYNDKGEAFIDDTISVDGGYTSYSSEDDATAPALLHHDAPLKVRIAQALSRGVRRGLYLLIEPHGHIEDEALLSTSCFLFPSVFFRPDKDHGIAVEGGRVQLPRARSPPRHSTSRAPQRSHSSLSTLQLIRLNAFHFIHTRLFEGIILTIIIFSCVLFFDPFPSIARDMDILLFCLFLAEMLLKWFALGVLLHKGSYFRVGWNILDCIMLIFQFLAIFSYLNGIAIFRLLRVLRPLRSLNVLAGMKVLAQGLALSISGLFSVLLLVLLFFFVFGIIGLQAFSGLLHLRCVDPTSDTYYSNVFCSKDGGQLPRGAPVPAYQNDQSIVDIGLLGSTCPQGLVCRPVASNPFFGFVGFDNFLQVFMLLVDVMGFEGCGSLLFKMYHIAGYFTFLYFFVLIVVGSYIIPNLALAVINERFARSQKRHYNESNANSVIRALTWAPILDNNIMLTGPEEDDVVPLSPRRQLDALSIKTAGDDDCASLRPRAARKSRWFADYGPSIGTQQALDNYSQSRHRALIHSAKMSRASRLLLGLRNWCHRFATGHRLYEHRRHAVAVEYHAEYTLYCRRHEPLPPHEPYEASAPQPPGIPRFMSRNEYSEYVKENHRASILSVIIAIVLILNLLIHALHHYGEPEGITKLIHISNIIFVAIFIIELIIRFIALGAARFISSPLLLFDTIVTLISFVGLLLGGEDELDIMHTVRLLRLLDLAHVVAVTKHVVGVLSRATTYSKYLIFLLLLFEFMVAMAGNALFNSPIDVSNDPYPTVTMTGGPEAGTTLVDWHQTRRMLSHRDNATFARTNYTIHFYHGFSSRSGEELDVFRVPNAFSDLTHALFTGFQILALDGWSSLLWATMKTHSAVTSVVFFLFTIFIGNVIIISLFLSIMITAFLDTTTQEEQLLGRCNLTSTMSRAFLNALDRLGNGFAMLCGRRPTAIEENTSVTLRMHHSSIPLTEGNLRVLVRQHNSPVPRRYLRTSLGAAAPLPDALEEEMHATTIVGGTAWDGISIDRSEMAGQPRGEVDSNAIFLGGEMPARSVPEVLDLVRASENRTDPLPVCPVCGTLMQATLPSPALQSILLPSELHERRGHCAANRDRQRRLELLKLVRSFLLSLIDFPKLQRTPLDHSVIRDGAPRGTRIANWLASVIPPVICDPAINMENPWATRKPSTAMRIILDRLQSPLLKAALLGQPLPEEPLSDANNEAEPSPPWITPRDSGDTDDIIHCLSGTATCLEEHAFAGAHALPHAVCGLPAISNDASVMDCVLRYSKSDERAVAMAISYVDDTIFLLNNLETGLEVVGGSATSLSRAAVSAPNYVNEYHSLGTFSPKSRFRQACARLYHTVAVEAIVMTCIILSCVFLVFANPTYSLSKPAKDALFVGELVLLSIFVAHLTLGIIADGLILHPGAYLRNIWHVLDFAVVILSIAVLFIPKDLPGHAAYGLKGLKSVKALLPLQLVTHTSGLRLVCSSLVRSVRGIFGVSFIAFGAYAIFGIIGVQLFAGSFHRCTDPTVLTKDKCHGTFYFTTNSAAGGTPEVVAGERLWVNPVYHFDSFGMALLTLFEVSNGKVMNVMHTAMQAVNDTHAPVEERNHYYSIYFILFFIVSRLILINQLIAVVVYNFNRQRSLLSDLPLLTVSQSAWVETARIFYNFRPQPRLVAPNVRHMLSAGRCSRALAHWRLWCYRVVSSRLFEPIFIIIIIVNAIVLAMEDYTRRDMSYATALHWLNHACFFFYLVETILRVSAMGAKDYFAINWFRFDFFVLIVSIIDLALEMAGGAVDLSLVRVLRLLRVLRVVRLLGRSTKTEVLIETVIFSLPSLFNIFVLLLVFFFIFAMLGNQLFYRVRPGIGLDEIWANFSNVGTALQLLFIFMTKELWPQVMHDCMVEPPQCGAVDGEGNVISTSDCGTPLAPVYFTLFVVMSSFIIVNMFVEVILNNYDHSLQLSRWHRDRAPRWRLIIDAPHAPRGRRTLAELLALQEAWAQLNPQASWMLPLSLLPRLLPRLPPPVGVRAALSKKSLLGHLTANLPVSNRRGYIHYAEMLIPLSNAVWLAGGGENKAAHDAMWHTVIQDLNALPTVPASARGTPASTVGMWFAATMIQSVARGWFVRRRMKQPKETTCGYFS